MSVMCQLYLCIYMPLVFANIPIPTVPPLQPTNLIVSNVYSTSAQLNWTISRVTFGFETYFVRYGLSSEVLDMESDIQIVTLDSSVENATYSITIENLQPFTTYYYNIAATNVVGETVSDIDSFTTGKRIRTFTKLYDLYILCICKILLPVCATLNSPLPCV